MNVLNRLTNAVVEFFLIFRIRNTIHRMQDDMLKEQHRPLTNTDETLDKYVDELLTRIDRDIRTYTDGGGRISLPDIRETLPKKIWMSGEIVAWNGWLEDLTSVRRDGSCTLEKRISDERFRLQVSLTLDNLTLGYDDYRINVGSSIKRTGKMSLKVLDNSLLLLISLPPPATTKSKSKSTSTSKFKTSSTSKSGCKNNSRQKARLKDVTVTKLENIRIEVTGCGKIGNKLAKKAILWMINQQMDQIKERIRNALMDSIRNTIERALWDGC